MTETIRLHLDYFRRVRMVLRKTYATAFALRAVLVNYQLHLISALTLKPEAQAASKNVI
jgi:hypothetical protein